MMQLKSQKLMFGSIKTLALGTLAAFLFQVIVLRVVRAEEAAAPVLAPIDEAENEADSVGSDADTAAETIKSLRAPKKKENYKKSKLTSDESEIKADKRSILLNSGESKTVDLGFEYAGRDAVAIGDTNIIQVDLVKNGTKRQIVFKPRKAGETSVTLRDVENNLRLVFHVTVTASNLLRRASEIRELIQDIEGVEVKVLGQKIIVDGEVLVPADYGRLLSVITDKIYSDQVMNLTTLSPLAIQVLSRKIQDDVNVFAANVKTRVVNGMVFLEGTTDSFDQAKKAYEIAKLYLPEVKPGNQLLSKDPSAQAITRAIVQSFIIVNAPPPKKLSKLVRVTVHFVELRKDYSKAFAFKWAPGFTEDSGIKIGSNQAGQTAAGGSGFGGIIRSLFPTLKSAQDAGYARILNSGTIIVRSGQAAEINNQTEFPFTVIGANGQAQGLTKNVGLVIGVTPQILGQSEDIELDIDMNQAELVGRGVAAGGAPVVANHRVKTKFYVKNNESAAVAGVNTNRAGTDYNKDDPKAGGIAGTDPLFNLLHSKSFRKEKSQFVIFVTPQIVDNASDGTEDLKKNFRIKVK